MCVQKSIEKSTYAQITIFKRTLSYIALLKWVAVQKRLKNTALNRLNVGEANLYMSHNNVNFWKIIAYQNFSALRFNDSNFFQKLMDSILCFGATLCWKKCL